MWLPPCWIFQQLLVKTFKKATFSIQKAWLARIIRVFLRVNQSRKNIRCANVSLSNKYWGSPPSPKSLSQKSVPAWCRDTGTCRLAAYLCNPGIKRAGICPDRAWDQRKKQDTGRTGPDSYQVSEYLRLAKELDEKIAANCRGLCPNKNF